MALRKLYKNNFSNSTKSYTEMSNPEKVIVDDSKEEDEDSEETLSDDEFHTREIVLGLPALSISEGFGVSNVVVEEEEEEKEARLNEQAVVAAELVMAAAEEAVMKAKSDDGGSGGKKSKKVSRPRKTTKTDDEASGSGKVESKKPRKRSSELTNPPEGPPVCNICGRHFRSWKAVFGHLRCHKDRDYQGFRPPPTFSAAAEKFSIPGQNSAFVLVAAGGGSSRGFSAGGGTAAPGGEGGRCLGIDLNVNPVEEEEHEVAESGSIPKFDLNKPPPNDEEEEEEDKGK